MNAPIKLTSMPLKACVLFICIAALLAATAHASVVVEIPATTTGYAWQNEDYQHYITYGKVYGNLKLSEFSAHTQSYSSRPFLKFALDTLPDSCRVISADLNYYQYYHYILPITVLKLIPDPVPLDGGAILSAVRDGPELCSHELAQDGWQRRPLNDFALHALDSCRGVGSMSLGIDCLSHELPYECDAYGDSGAFPPYLRVDYTLSGVDELATPHLLPPPFAFTPNPASGGFVTVRYQVAAGTRSTLTLRDVLGRVSEAFTLDPSGSTRLDLRGFAPGVYMATIEASGVSISGRLIITAR